MKLAAMICGAALLTAGCKGGSLDPYDIQSTFNADEVKYIYEEGDNAIAGQAFLRQNGGGVVTCAGKEVRLIPAGQYARERIGKIYQTTTRPGIAYKFVTDPNPNYVRMVRTTTCDAQGAFRFEKVADGAYFAVTDVRWLAGFSPQGGTVMAPVRVSGGGDHQVIVSP